MGRNFVLNASPNFEGAQALPMDQAEFLRRFSHRMSFAERPYRKRHASLDTGVGEFRSRQNSLAYGTDSSNNSSFAEEEKYLLHDYPSPLGYMPSASARFKRKLTSLTIALRIGGILLVGAIIGVVLWSRPSVSGRVHQVLEDLGVPQGAQFCENPYAEYGRITVDQKKPENNRWVPYDTTCRPPELMAALRASPTFDEEAPEYPLQLPLPVRKAPLGPKLALPWLHGKTVLLFGDHVERLHNKDFCRFAGGQFATIGKTHPLSPPSFVNGIDEKFQTNETNYDGSRPAVCYIEEHDFAIISVFHFGLANRVEFGHEHLLYDPHFYPPVALHDRLAQIILPLLHSLGRPKPDLIEFSSGFWDLRHFTALDEMAGQDPFAELSNERLQWYSDRLRRSLNDLSETFPGVPLLWRALHHTPKFINTPFSRVAALDHLGRKVIRDMNAAKQHSSKGSSDDDSNARIWTPSQPHDSGAGKAGRRKKQTAKEYDRDLDRKLYHETFLDRVKSRIAQGVPVNSNHQQQPVAVAVKGRSRSKSRMSGVSSTSTSANTGTSTSTGTPGQIRIDEWGSLMLGQEHLMNNVHTPPLPGGYIWGDIILFELRRQAIAASSSRNLKLI